MCSLWCADFPHRPGVLFGFSERESLVVFDDGSKGLPTLNITTDKL